MERREFLTSIGTVVILFPMARVLSACGGSSSTGTPTNTPSSTPSTTLSFTSSVVSGHSHGLELEQPVITDSPVGGVSETTSAASGHTHVLTLTEADLDSLQAGQTLTRETTLDNGHVHAFTLATSTSSTPQPTQPSNSPPSYP